MLLNKIYWMICTKSILFINWLNAWNMYILRGWCIGMLNPQIYWSILIAKLGSVILDSQEHCGGIIIKRPNLLSSLPPDGIVRQKYSLAANCTIPNPICGVWAAWFINCMREGHYCQEMILLNRYKKCWNLKDSPTRNKKSHSKSPK